MKTIPLTRGYSVVIRVDRKLIPLGTCESEEEAARLYDAAAIRYFGEFAKLNFPLAHGARPQ